ncbi:Glycine oxidase [Paenibacillus konkukensis]|uniref:glycine oxidase n=1 Tax=Paenibacillus konkukensis TaxID=2020716 RepID=A0ABY4RLB7_9BACL|nr:glycine oxidase ThiO [Paenibacillus konkukensis]UQZ82923.1 Glycine oxidase [Paenibacillus konkukensis]
MNSTTSAIIIGGGIIGCAIASELLRAGVRCTLIDKGALLQEASTAAAGMLGAQVEIHHPGHFYELCRWSQQLYREWTEQLQRISGGVSPQYINEGILRTAWDEEDERELRSRLGWIQDAEWLEADGLRALEPAMAAGIRGGFHFPNDHQVHPVHLAKTLQAALYKQGCTIREWTPAFGLIERGGRIAGVRTSEGELLADHVIVSAGAWSPALTAPWGIELPMFPVKGQCISVRTDAPVTRKTVFTKGCYIIPKQDGTYLIGATQEEAGFDKRCHVSAVSALHAKAAKLLPQLAQAEFVGTWAGLRPGTRDGLPFLGAPSKAPGLIVATGQFRNGILLAPATAKLVMQLVTGSRTELDLTPFHPDRVLAAAVD